MARRVIVLRHGQSTHNAAGLWQGQTDPPLSEVGRDQVRAAAAVLARRGVTRVVASDLERAADTGRAVALAAGVECDLEPALREIDVGSWAGRSQDDVRRTDAAVLACIAAGEDPPRGGGETVAGVRRRVMPTVERLLEELNEGQCMVLATHGMTGWVVADALTGGDGSRSDATRPVLGNARWVALRDDGDGAWHVEAWNAAA